jgi:hypothetical protein
MYPINYFSRRALRCLLSISLLICSVNGAQAMLTLDFTTQNLSIDEITLAECMQGLVNRSGPTIYYTCVDYNNSVGSPYISYIWLNYLTNASPNGLGMVVTNEANLAAMITQARNRGVINGLVVYNSTDSENEVPIALTLCAQLGGLPVTTTITNYQSPGLLNKGNNCFAGLPVLTNISGKWSTRLAACRSETNLLAASSTNECFYDGAQWYGPTSDASSNSCCESGFGGRDYAVKLNAFLFDYPINNANWQSAGYGPLFTNVMNHLHVPAAVFGVWPGYGDDVSGDNNGEGFTTPLVSSFGNYWCESHEVMNLSYLSGIPVSSTNLYLRRPPHHLTLDKTKYYVLFQSDGGDTYDVAYDMPGNTGWNSVDRGTVPISWGMNPSQSQRFPVYLQWLNTFASSKDTYFGGCGGVGYTWLGVLSTSQQIALGAASEPYLQATGIQLLDPWGATPSSLVNFASTATNVQAFTHEYGPTNLLLSDNIPLTQCGAYGTPEGTWYPSQFNTNLNQIVGEVEALAAANNPPYFIPVYDTTWTISTEAAMCATNLGTNYVIVGVEDYIDLLDQYYLGTFPGENVLPNPGWDPTTVNGPDGGRDWTYTYNNDNDQAYQLNDLYDAGYPPVSDGSMGFLKVQVTGSNGSDFQYAQSQWFTASPGESWSASVYADAEYTMMYGAQVGQVKIQFANSSYSIIGSNTRVIINTNSPDAYFFGGVTMTAPSNAAYVNMQVGLYNPTSGNTAGVALFDSADLETGVTPPAAPTGLTATAGSGKVSLSWTGSLGAASYNVKRSTTSGGEGTIINVTSTLYTDTGLAHSKKYYYVVSAVDTGVESANSSEKSATTR